MSDLGNFYSVGPVLFGGIDDASPISHVTADSNAAVAKLGSRVTFKGEDYVYMHNAQASSALSVGRPCVMSALSGYSLTDATVSKADLPICVIKHAEIPSGGYGWGLVRGIAEALLVENTAATGDLLSTGSGGVAISALAGSFPTQAAWAQVLSSGTGAVKAYVRCVG